MGQRIVDGGDLVGQGVGIVLVPADPLLDDALIVRVQRNAGGVEGAGPLK